MSDPEVLS